MLASVVAVRFWFLVSFSLLLGSLPQRRTLHSRFNIFSSPRASAFWAALRNVEAARFLDPSRPPLACQSHVAKARHPREHKYPRHQKAQLQTHPNVALARVIVYNQLNQLAARPPDDDLRRVPFERKRAPNRYVHAGKQHHA